MAASKTTVSNYLTQKLAMCGKSQKDVAREAGYPNPNILTMFKKGTTRVPYAAVGRLSKAIGIDPAELLRLTLKEYDPELWGTLEQTLAAQPICSASEAELFRMIVHTAQGRPLDMTDRHNRHEVRMLVRKIAVTTDAFAQMEVHRLESMPRNSPERHS